MMSTSISIAIAAVICFSIYRLGKWYVENYCQDNPTTVWIWLDDDAQDSGRPVKDEDRQKNASIHLCL